MTPQEFCYWLQGLFEVGDVKKLDERQTAIVRDHLQEVFTKVTPARPVVLPERDIRYPGGRAPEPARTLIVELGQHWRERESGTLWRVAELAGLQVTLKSIPSPASGDREIADLIRTWESVLTDFDQVPVSADDDLIGSIRRAARAMGPLPPRLCGGGERYC